MSTDVGSRGFVALFYKRASGRLELFSVTTIQRTHSRHGTAIDRREYDVDWSKRYGYLFHESGAGGGLSPVLVDGIYYVSRGIPVKEQPSRLVNRAARLRNGTRRISRMPAKFKCDDGDVLDWLERNGIQEDAVWCSECNDFMPATGYDYCEHVWWCDKTGWYSTPSERCACSGWEECSGDDR